MLQGVHQETMDKHDMRKCGKNILNNRYEQQVQAIQYRSNMIYIINGIR